MTRRRRCGSAVTALDELPDTRLIACSRLYSQSADGAAGSARLRECGCGPADPAGAGGVAAEMQALETRLGRVRKLRGDKWGPRVIDLDLLVYGRTRLPALMD